jgi:hypothetical protein
MTARGRLVDRSPQRLTEALAETFQTFSADPVGSPDLQFQEFINTITLTRAVQWRRSGIIAADTTVEPPPVSLFLSVEW